jgi:hypothetical protein
MGGRTLKKVKDIAAEERAGIAAHRDWSAAIRALRAPAPRQAGTRAQAARPPPGRFSSQTCQPLAWASWRAWSCVTCSRGAGPPADGLFPPGHWAANPDLDGLTHAPEAARALLAEAGVKPVPLLRLTLKTSSDPFRVRLATAIQAQAAEVGIELKFQS